MKTTLSSLFTPARKALLADAVRLRTSCRIFSGAPSEAEYAALAYQTGRYALSGARLVLLEADDSLFTATLLGMRRVTGCRMIAAVVISEREPLCRIHAGILGEAFVLEATAMGLGTCWVSGSYRRRQVNVPLREDEALLCVIAVGKPAQPLEAPATRHRKGPDQLCRGPWREWPEQLIRAATLVQQAPSSMNMQPWALWVNEGGSFVLDANERAQLDGGIALCHAELALTTPHEWQYGRARGEPMAWAKAR